MLSMSMGSLELCKPNILQIEWNLRKYSRGGRVFQEIDDEGKLKSCSFFVGRDFFFKIQKI